MTTATSLNGALLIAASGLQANQVGLDVVSRNVANAQVTGYTSKTAPLESIVTGDANAGVRTLAITRNVTEALLRQLQTSNSVNQQMSTQSAFLQSFQNNFGQPGNSTNLAAQIGNLQNALSALTVSPDDPTAQTQVISTAQNVTQQFNLVTQNLGQVRQQADAAISTSVTNVNTALNQIFTLNNQITALQARGESTADLQDQRDNQVNAVAKEMGITTAVQGNGAMYVYTGNGTTLLDSTFAANSSPVTFTPTPVVGPNAAYYPPPSSTFGGLSGISVGGVDITGAIQGGNIAGDLNVRDNILPATQSQLDELAAQLATKFNTNDLQLFQRGNQILPSADTVTNVGGVATGGNSITVQSITNLSVGMSLHFGSQPNTTYLITGINTGTNTLSFVQQGTTTGLTAGVAQDEKVTFGPAIPQITTGAAGGALGATTLTLADAIGAQTGMRIQFLGHSAIYTITNVAAGPPQQVTIQPDGTGVGLQAPVAAGEGIRILPPVIGLAGYANNITVNTNVINNPWRVRDGTRVQTPSTLTGNNTLPTNLVTMFNALQTFTNNTKLATSATLVNFGSSAIAYQANVTATTKATLDSATTIYNSLNRQFLDESAVNVDTQLSNMITIQSSYAASARTITAIKQMMDELEQAVR
ncbi:MAG TPA: flagellar hook-associated protein FlgK [Alphaproteobacteria bacterium]